MELRVLGCQGGSAPKRHLPGLLLDGTVLLEAGSVTSTLELGGQLETSFPNRLDALAEISGHLTPSGLAWELDKMPPCPVWVYHIKPMFYDETVDELTRLDSRVRVLSDGEVHVL